ncbi:transposase [Escherichia coli]|nr:transposase [Escherichia coli]
MLSREDFYMTKQMRQQGAYIVDIATQVVCSERTVIRYLNLQPEKRATKWPKSYIDMRQAENVWNGEVLLVEIKAMG